MEQLAFEALAPSEHWNESASLAEPSGALGVAYSDYNQRLVALLRGELDFHDQPGSCAPHDWHAFPARFPPPLPTWFIYGLTEPGGVVLDPMMGSGTTVLEAWRAGRQAVGFDLDPLACLLASVKVTPFDPLALMEQGRAILQRARGRVATQSSALDRSLAARWDSATRRFVDYWFAPQIQRELLALVEEIERLAAPETRDFFRLALSAIIITKSGGVSMAFDLAHTRPHRAKVVWDQAGRLILGEEWANDPSPRVQFLTKTLRSPLAEWERRLERNLRGLPTLAGGQYPARTQAGDAQSLPLPDGSVDLIVTSPPYAANAIDYMRAHKFSLVWLGHSVKELSRLRQGYIGGESTSDFAFETFPSHVREVIAKLTRLDEKKGKVLSRYYSEMVRVLGETHRVLKPGRAAIFVVGNSVMRGLDTETSRCLAEIGRSLGFAVPAVGVRNLDRNRRMLPASHHLDLSSQIQQRMHEEYVIGFYKPGAV